MARRLPSSPPQLPGYTPVRLIGSGGFADVFLYEQNLPRRQVAVKVLLAELVTGQVRDMFLAEATLMAQLSSHPSILTVYHAGVSADGRPYLVTEYCSSTLGQGYRSRPLSIPEALRVGIRIGSALETAHRSGVLHRDVKPSNILTTAYGHPVLADFGIASTLADSDTSDAQALSVPWAAPEVILDETGGSVTSEVWSLAATVYSLIAGRSPFEKPDTDTATTELMARIRKGTLGRIDRADVPARLETVLATALSVRPDRRPQSILELIRQFQAVETDLGLVQTPLEVETDLWAGGTTPEPLDRTQVRAAVGEMPPSGRRRPKSRRTLTPVGARTTSAGGRSTVAARRTPRRRTVAIISAGAGVLATIAVALAVGSSAAEAIPTVGTISAEHAPGEVRFSWDDPGIRAGDLYQVTVTGSTPSLQASTGFRITGTASETVCITVAVSHAGTAGDRSALTCARIPPDSAP